MADLCRLHLTLRLVEFIFMLCFVKGDGDILAEELRPQLSQVFKCYMPTTLAKQVVSFVIRLLAMIVVYTLFHYSAE